MSSKETMLEPIPTNGGLGNIGGYSTANSVLLGKAFHQSPINGEDRTLTDEAAKEEYEKVLDEPINDAGHFFGEFNPKFVNAPDLKEVKTGGGGLPATPYVPNVASPGEGSNNPTDLPEPPNTDQVASNTTFGAGGGTTDPSKTSAEVAKSKLGDYLMPGVEQYGKSIYSGD